VKASVQPRCGLHLQRPAVASAGRAPIGWPAPDSTVHGAAPDTTTTPNREGLFHRSYPLVSGAIAELRGVEGVPAPQRHPSSSDRRRSTAANTATIPHLPLTRLHHPIQLTIEIPFHQKTSPASNSSEQNTRARTNQKLPHRSACAESRCESFVICRLTWLGQSGRWMLIVFHLTPIHTTGFARTVKLPARWPTRADRVQLRREACLHLGRSPCGSARPSPHLRARRRTTGARTARALVTIGALRPLHPPRHPRSINVQPPGAAVGVLAVRIMLKPLVLGGGGDLVGDDAGSAIIASCLPLGGCTPMSDTGRRRVRSSWVCSPSGLSFLLTLVSS